MKYGNRVLIICHSSWNCRRSHLKMIQM